MKKLLAAIAFCLAALLCLGRPAGLWAAGVKVAPPASEPNRVQPAGLEAAPAPAGELHAQSPRQSQYCAKRGLIGKTGVAADILFVLIVLLVILLEWKNRQLRMQKRQLAADISGRKLAESKLQQEAETRDRLLAALGEGVYGVDMMGRCTFANPATLNMLGFEESELLGQKHHALIHHRYPDGRAYPEEECPIHQTLQDGQKRHSDEWFFTKGDFMFPVEITVAPLNQESKQVGAVVVFRDISKRKQLEAELQALATTDYLTGLPNRRHFLEFLERELARLRRFEEPATALLMLDLDHFKRINDRYGHAAGDAVLRRFAELVQSGLRKTDHAGRLGGEEFAILLFGTDLQGAAEFADRLREEIAAEEIDVDGNKLQITVSIGVVQLSAKDHSTDTVLARVDAALYRAKNDGRNRVRWA